MRLKSFALLLLLYVNYVYVLDNSHNIIWHITHNAHSSNQNSWDNLTFTLKYSDSSNDYSSEIPTTVQTHIQNWSDLALELQHNRTKFEHFQAAYKELDIGINYVGRLLQEAKPSDQMSHIVKIIELVEFASGSGSNSFQKSVAELLVKLEPYLLDQFGNIRQSLSLIESWRYNSIIKEFTARVGDWYSFAGAIECAQNALYGSCGKCDFIQSGNKQLLTRYLNNVEIKQYLTMRDLLNQGNLAQAHEIVKANSFRFSKPTQNYFLARYQQEFKNKYNFQGIKNEYFGTSYYKSHLTALPASQIPSAYNTAIEQYLEAQQRICGHTDNVSAAMEQIVEKIQEIGLDNKQTVIEYFCKELCSDHSNAEKAKIFGQLSNHFGAPKWFKYNDAVKYMRFDPEITTAAHTAERILVAQLGLLDCPNEFGRIQTALGYLDRACGSDESASRFATFGRLLAEDIIAGKYSDISQLPDFNLSVSANQEKVQDALIILCEDLLLKAEQSQEKINPVLIKNIGHAYAGMMAGKKTDTVYLQECLLPTPCLMALNLELPLGTYRILHMPQQTEICCEHVKARVAACRDIEKNGFIIETIDNRFTPRERITLIHHDIDPGEIEHFTGNQLERVDHQLRMRDLKALAHAHEQKFHPAVAPIIEFAFKSDSLCKIYSDYKLQGSMYAFGTLRSMAVACVKQMYAIDKKIAIGAAQGVWDGVKNVSHMAVNWQQTLTEAAQGIDSLAQVLDHCLWRINEFVIDVYKQPEKAKEDFGTFCESAIKFNQEMRQKIYEKGFADCSRECAKFATETFLIGKLTDFALVGCNAIEAQTQHLLDNYKGLAYEAESITAVTTEGVEVRLTQKAENCVFSEIQDSSRKLPQRVLSAEKLPELSVQMIEEAVSYATTESKLEHIFAKKCHKLDPLVKALGGERQVVREVIRALDGRLPLKGEFKDIIVKVGGFEIFVRGSVHEGIPKIGTMFIPLKV